MKPTTKAFAADAEKAKSRPRSRRKPRLRLVGELDARPRREGTLRIGGVTYILRVLTPEEYGELPPRDPGDTVITLPGLGFAVLRLAMSKLEEQDVRDVEDQALDEWGFYRISND